MYLQGLANRVPPPSYSQADCWEIITRSGAFSSLSERAASLLRRVLLGNGGIERRHFAVPSIEGVFDLDAEALNRTFEKQAPALGSAAVSDALDRAGVLPNQVDALYVATCTGYLCPGVSSHVAQSLGLQAGAHLVDLVGLGCGAAIPMLRQVGHHLRADPDATVVALAVEVCSAAFYLDNDPGVLISLCLFGDGASASVWRGQPPSDGEAQWRADDFQTLHRPEDREILRFENRGGKLRNRLHKTVPEKAATAVGHLWDTRPGANGAHPVVLSHAGGRDVVEAIEERLNTPTLHPTREVLRRYGNMSSPSVLFALEEALKGEGTANQYWLTSFGAGFAAHACQLTRS